MRLWVKILLFNSQVQLDKFILTASIYEGFLGQDYGLFYIYYSVSFFCSIYCFFLLGLPGENQPTAATIIAVLA